jgi:hypothetical protein
LDASSCHSLLPFPIIKLDFQSRKKNVNRFTKIDARFAVPVYNFVVAANFAPETRELALPSIELGPYGVAWLAAVSK